MIYRRLGVIGISAFLFGVLCSSTARELYISPLTSHLSPLPSPPSPQEDSLRAQKDTLRARFRVQKTAPIIVEDLDSSALDLRRPDNIRQTVEYDDSANVYYVGSKIGDSYLNAPVLMSPEEYRKWSERRMMQEFFRKKNTVQVQL